MKRLSDYNKQHLEAQLKALDVCSGLSKEEICYLKWLSLAYMQFRAELDNFTSHFVYGYCRNTCFKTKESKCCSFESIISFFADEVLNIIWGGPEKAEALIKVLEQPNDSSRCVYLGENGCLWYLKPISCAMFFCDDVKKYIFSSNSNVQRLWAVLINCEKNFTWPVRPVLFDLIEEFFIIKKGVFTPHMYLHLSPGLLKIKKNASYSFKLPTFF